MLVGLGPLHEFMSSPDVLEVMVVNGRDIWVERTTGTTHAGELTATELSLVVEGISRLSGRRVDTLAPILDARLPDGSRACVVLTPIAVHGTSVNIRKFPQRSLPLAAFGSEQLCDQVRELIVSRANVVVSGETSSGKTSLVSAATEWFSPHDRVVCVEDTAEVRFKHGHVVCLQTRPANQEGTGCVSLQDLVRTSLRMRPDRLVVGEVRGPEVVDMLLALSSGHSGSWSTVHAPSAVRTTDRLVALVQRHHPQWTHRDANRLVHGALNAVIHITRLPTGKRIITDVLTLSSSQFSP